MRSIRKFIPAAALVAATIDHAYAQYTPPPPEPFAGFINDAIRQANTNLSALDIGGTERLRFVNYGGYGIPGTPGTPAAPNNDFRAHGAEVSNDYLLSRMRLHVAYSDTWWSVYVEGQSSLAAADERFAYANVPPVAGTVARVGSGPESDILDLHQGYATVGNLNEFPLALKVGRQELSYGEERLIGAFDWNNIGRTFDAVKMRVQSEWVSADLFASHPVIPTDGKFNSDNSHDFFSGIYATTAQLPKQTLDAYFLSRNADRFAASAQQSPQFPQPSAQDIYTIGGRLWSKPGELWNWDYSLEGAYQFGNFRDPRAGAPTTRLKQNAFMFCAWGGYTFTNVCAQPRLGAEFDYASGNGNARETDGDHETFQNLFPTNHKFYGSMDFASLQNIQDAGVNLSLKPHRRVVVTLMGNFLWLASTSDSFYTVSGTPRGGTLPTPGTGFGVNPGYNNYLGSEVTAIVGWTVARFAQAEAGYGHFFHGQYLSQTWSAANFGARDANFAYLQLKLKF